MVLNCYVPNVKIINKKVIEGKVKDDGTFNTYYSLGVIAGDDLGKANCTLDVYNEVSEGKTYDMHFVINTDYKDIWVKFDACSETKSSK